MGCFYGWFCIENMDNFVGLGMLMVVFWDGNLWILYGLMVGYVLVGDLEVCIGNCV